MCLTRDEAMNQEMNKIKKLFIHSQIKDDIKMMFSMLRTSLRPEFKRGKTARKVNSLWEAFQ